MTRSAAFLLVGALVAAACSTTGVEDLATTATTTPAVQPEGSSAPTAPPTTAPSPDTTAPESSTPGQTELSARPGADGLGDSYYPSSGNGGYDVGHYTITLEVDPDNNFVDGWVDIEAVLTEAVTSINLDLVGLNVAGIQVDGKTANFSRSLSELTIELGELRPAEDPLAIRVVFSGTPEPVIGPILGDIGWIDGPVGSYVVSEPTGTPTWFPVNDHPLDKATYTFVVTVPDGWEAVANGQLVDEEIVDTGVTFTWETREPLAPYLATVAVGQFEFTTEEGPDGVVIRNAFPPEVVEAATFDFGRTSEMIEVFNKLFGPYPFEAYGALVVDDTFNFALEDQTFSVFTRQFVTGDRSLEWIYAHELAHQWFGDSVSVADWSDIWLNEGFATYAEHLWTEFDSGTDTNFAMEQLWQSSVDLGPPGSPGADRLFATEVYDRGALALHALRLTVGDDPFFEILSSWTDEYAYSNASTDDFIVLAERVSGQDLLELIDSFVYGETLPPLPE